MTTHEIYLPEYDWRAIILFEVTPRDVYPMVEYMEAAHISQNKIRKACLIISAGRINAGVTASNFEAGETVIAITPTSSREEFFLSVEHEARHLADHISQVYGLNNDVEKPAYLTEDINKQLYNIIYNKICTCHVQ